ncbi:CopD family protein [Streptomyces sp. NPDC000410]|uniref:CopD family protein n=1 Tax=Streptomyces sp. NPDC000410 TaxID=3154254 RepID=UPI00331C31BF
MPRPLTAAAIAGGTLAALVVALLGVAIATHGTGELRIPAPGTTTALRAVVFVALAVHIGELAGRRLAGPGPRPRDWGLWAALAGAGASAGQILVLAAVSHLDVTAAYATRDGVLLLLMANGFTFAALCAGLGRPARALAPLALVVLAEALRAHPEPVSPEVGTALTVVHLTAASLWSGGLLYVLRTMWLRRAEPEAGRAVLARYARLAPYPFAAVALTGTVTSLRRLPADVVFTTAYGRVLIAKLVLVAVVSVLALTARHRLIRGRDDSQVPARVEVALLALALLVSAVLTVVPDPHWLSTR